jgi:hypothetical protein
MKLNIFVYLLLMCSSIGLVNCSKTSDATAPDYSPLSAGSSWTYTGSAGTFTLTATNRDTVANGKNYRVITNSNGPNYYLGKNGNDYYRFGALAALNMSGVEELYLKDNQAVNATWATTQTFNAPGIPIPLTANLNYTVKSKDGSRTVGGKTFNNVIHVRLDISVVGLGSVGGGDFYYAAGVGMIENAIAVTAPGLSLTQTQTLTAYTIK